MKRGLGFFVSTPQSNSSYVGKDEKNLKDLLAHHTDGPDFDRCRSFNSGAGLRVNRILNTK